MQQKNTFHIMIRLIPYIMPKATEVESGVNLESGRAPAIELVWGSWLTFRILRLPKTVSHSVMLRFALILIATSCLTVLIV